MFLAVILFVSVISPLCDKMNLLVFKSVLFYAGPRDGTVVKQNHSAVRLKED